MRRGGRGGGARNAADVPIQFMPVPVGAATGSVLRTRVVPAKARGGAPISSRSLERIPGNPWMLTMCFSSTGVFT